jgi:hypothetical protein
MMSFAPGRAVTRVGGVAPVQVSPIAVGVLSDSEREKVVLESHIK